MEYLWRDTENWCLDCLWENYVDGAQVGRQTFTTYSFDLCISYHMSVISINVVSFKTNKPPSHKVLKESDKSYSTTELLVPLGGSDKVVIHGIIMIVSFAELSLWAGHRIMACTSPFRPCHNPRGSPFSERGVSAAEKQRNLAPS